MLTVIEHESFNKEASRLLTSEQREDFINYISVRYKKGDIMTGTGGLQKIRYAHRAGKGKSGGVRIVYLVVDRKGCIHLLEIFEKKDKENISQAEKNILKKLVEQLKN